jgi:exosortase/archaeosortase family protein
MAAKKKHRVAKPKQRPKFDWRGDVVRLLPFAVVYIALEYLIKSLADSGRLLFLQEWTASAARWLLGVFGTRTVIAGCSVVTDAGTVTVNGLCLPVTPMALGVALILCGTSLPPVKKLVFVATLVPLMLLVGVLRIAVVAALVNASSPFMPTFHETISPIAWMVVPIGLWLFALRGTDRA